METAFTVYQNGAIFGIMLTRTQRRIFGIFSYVSFYASIVVTLPYRRANNLVMILMADLGIRCVSLSLHNLELNCLLRLTEPIFGPRVEELQVDAAHSPTTSQFLGREHYVNLTTKIIIINIGAPVDSSRWEYVLVSKTLSVLIYLSV